MVVLLQRVDDLVLEGEEQTDQEDNGSGNPTELDVQQYAYQYAQCGNHADPCSTAVGERQCKAQQDHDTNDDQTAALLDAGQEDIGEGEDEVDGQSRAIGRVVIVEGGHHPVGRVAIEAELCVMDDGVDAYNTQGADIEPNEPMYVLWALEQYSA